MKKITLLFLMLIALLSASETFAQKAVVIGTTHSGTDSFSFLVTQPIANGEFVYFSEDEYNNATNVFAAGESVVRFTASSALTVGTVIRVQEGASNVLAVSCTGGGACGTATVLSGFFSLRTDGESYYAYSDTDGNPTNGVTEIYSVFYTGESGQATGGTIPAALNPTPDFPNAIVVDGFPAVSPNRTEYAFAGAVRDNLCRTDLENTSNYLHAQAFQPLSNTVFTGFVLPCASPTMTVTRTPGSVVENSGSSITYTFTLGVAAPSPVTVNFSVGGTATFVSDYGQSGAASFGVTAGTVVIGSGMTTANVTVTPSGDTNLEPDETIVLTAVAGTGYSVGSPSSGTATITNDDTMAITPAVAVTGLNNAISPGIEGFSFVALDDITAGTQIYFTEEEFNINTLAFSNTSGEGVVRWTAPAGGVTRGQVIVGTENTPDTFTATCDSGSCGSFTTIITGFTFASNGEGFFAYSDSDANPMNGVTQVHAVLFTGTNATPGGNIPAIENPATVYTGAVVVDGFPASQPQKTEYTPGLRAVTVDQANFQNIANWDHAQTPATLNTTPFANIIIATGSANPAASVAVAPASVMEDSGTGMVYTFTLDAPAAAATTINFDVSGTATLTTDYTQAGAASFSATAGTVVIPNGGTSAAVTITPVVDTDVETTETIELMIAAGTGYDGGTPNAATGSITNDDTSNSDPLVALMGMAHDGGSPDAFSFAAAQDIPAGTTVYFTEDEFDNTTLMFSAGESVLQYTSPAGGQIDQGDVIVITETAPDTFAVTCSDTSGNGCGTVAVIVGGFALATNGETMYAYEDSDTDPTNGVDDIYAVMYTGNSSTSGGNIPALEDPSGIYLSALVVDGFPAVAPMKTEYTPADRAIPVGMADFENPTNYDHAFAIGTGLSTIPFANLGIVDTMSPVITCPANVTIECGGDTSPTGTGTATATDNIDPTPTITFGDTSVSGCGNTEVITRTWTATDDAGNSSSCVQTITVVDTTPPTVTAPANATVECGGDTSPTGTGTATGTDGCGGVTITFADASVGGCGLTEVITRTWTSTDDCGNTAMAVQTITVVDTTPPTVVAPANATVECGDDTSPTATGTATGADGCGGVTITFTDASVAGCGLTETITRTWTSTDDCGNTAMAMQTITVVDTTLPTITCPANISVNNDAGLCTSVVNYTAPVGSDTCGTSTTVQIAGLASGVAYPVGITTNTFEVTDACGNVETCSFTVTVIDAEVPLISCPANITQDNDPGNCDAVVTWTAPVGTDNCPGSTTTSTHNPGDTFPVGTTTVTYTVTDAAGAMVTCSFDVTINDVEAPTLTCPADITMNNDPGICGAVVTYTDPVVTDNCNNLITAIFNFTSSVQTFTVPAGVTSVSIEALGGAGQAATIEQFDPSIGGLGGLASGELAVTPGDVLTIYVGGTGVDGVGGYNGGGVGGFGTPSTGIGGFAGSGGGASDVRIGAATLADRVIVAGGGGGGGRDYVNGTCVPCGIGGNGGDGGALIGENGDDPSWSGILGSFPNVGAGGSGGNQVAGGAAGDGPNGPAGNPGVAGNGGAGVNGTQSVASGGAGGGYFGGGSGGGTNAGNGVAGGGGAGGSSYIGGVTSGITTAGQRAGDGQISITYSAPPVATQTAGLSSGSVFPVGTTTNTFMVTDGAGNTAMCSFTVTVNDTENPVVTCPADITIANDPGVCTAAVIYTTPVGTDNCPGATTMQTAGLPSGSDFPIGTTTNTFVVTDASGNTATCSFDITVVDDNPPVAVCQDITVQIDAAGVASTSAADIDNGSSDLCSNPITLDIGALAYVGATTGASPTDQYFPPNTWFYDTYSFTAPIDGTYQLIHTSTSSDGAGTVAILYDAPPVRNSGDVDLRPEFVGFTNRNDAGAFIAGTANYVLSGGTTYYLDVASVFPGETTIYNGGVILQGDANFDCDDVGTVVLTLIVTDAVGNIASCTSTVTVEDTIPPAIVCPADITTTNDPGICGAVVTFVDPIGTDNCAGATTAQIAGLPSGSTFPVGVTTNTFMVTDASGNMTSCSFMVTVTDVEPPVITCPADITQNNDPGLCSAVITYADPVVTDNCSTTTTTNSLGTIFTGGNGQAGNMFDITAINDITINSFDLSLDPGAAETVEVYYKTGSYVGSETNAAAWTLIGTTTVTSAGINVPTPLNLSLGQVVSAGQTGAFWITLTTGTQMNYTNGANTYSNSDLQLDAGAGLAYPLGNGVFSPRTWNGNVVYDVTASNVTIMQTAGLASGSAFPVGTTTNTFVATDAAGNSSTCSFDVTVDDNEPPVAICMDITVQLDAAGNASITAADVGGGSTDNCGIASLAVSPSTFTCADVGPNTVTLTVTDVNGNASTCTAVVTVEDNVPPVAVCQNIDAFLDASGSVTITPADVDGGSTDACGIASLAIDIDTFTCDTDLGPNDVVLTVTDVNGNVSTCTAVVTVIDAIDPIIACPADITSSTTPGDCFAEVFFPDAIALDNCTVTVAQTGGLPSGSMFPVGVSTVEFTATDSSGNTAVCSFTVTVTDDEPAMAVCMDITIDLDATGNALITGADIDGGSTDNCGIASLVAIPNTFTCADVGPNNVILEVTDVNGNVSQCTAIVTVQDVTAPVVVCMDITVELDVNGTVTITGSDVDGGSTDACGIASYDLDIDTFTCADVGPNTVTLTVTDVNGNMSTCTAVVRVEDNIAPDLVCMDITVELDENGMAMIVPEDLMANNTDACGIFTTAVDIFEFDCDDIGTPITVTVFSQDNNGNNSVCTAIVTVVDLLAPEVTCPADQTVDPGPNTLFYEVPDYFATGEATAIDNCTDPLTITSQTPAAGTLLGDGVYDVTICITDEYGNEGCCTFELTVDSVLGTNNNGVDISTLVLYPNPARDYVNISNPQNVDLKTLQVYDLAGRLVISESLEGMGIDRRVDVSFLQSATYMFIIQSDNGQFTKQIVKE